MKELFVGKPIHWIMIAVVIAVMYGFGAFQFHRVDYSLFLFAVFGLAAGCVIIVLVTYRRGNRITRDSLEDETSE
jgi:cytochrome b561